MMIMVRLSLDILINMDLKCKKQYDFILSITIDYKVNKNIYKALIV